jgi:hypothetical protein
MGPLEEAGHTARSAVDALKSTPVILALVIFNVFFMAAGFYVSYENAQRFERMLTLCYERAT